MPQPYKRLLDSFSQKETAPVNCYEGFTSAGQVVVRDRCGTRKAEAPYPPNPRRWATIRSRSTNPRSPSTSMRPRRMGNFTGWNAAVNAIASKVANIQLRLYQVTGDDHEELPDHPLPTLLESVNEHMTGIELKYTTMAHLELTGNCYWLLDGVRNATDQPRVNRHAV